MSYIGIVAEFNPLHKGHEYLINSAKKDGGVVCVLSGNFVQRGEVAIAEKRIRAKAALLAGADLVLELPILWSMSTAQNFALGAVSILQNIGCDNIMFGSECGDTEALKRNAEILNSHKFSEKVKTYLEKGVTFASARQSAAVELGADSNILLGANNNLAIEYITAAKKMNFKGEFKTLKRIGADHDSKCEAEFVSASLLREKLRNNDYNFCSRYMSKEVLQLFSKENISNMRYGERGILSSLRALSLNQLRNLPDISEGVENKLYSSIRIATGLEELYNNIKVKRYTHARIRRMVLSAYLGIDNEWFMKTPPYIRVLGFNNKGREILSKGVNKSKVPVITRASDIKDISELSKKVFATECRATDLFSLFLKKPFECGLEYTSKIIKME